MPVACIVRNGVMQVSVCLANDANDTSANDANDASANDASGMHGANDVTQVPNSAT